MITEIRVMTVTGLIILAAIAYQQFIALVVILVAWGLAVVINKCVMRGK